VLLFEGLVVFELFYLVNLSLELNLIFMTMNSLLCALFLFMFLVHFGITLLKQKQ